MALKSGQRLAGMSAPPQPPPGGPPGEDDRGKAAAAAGADGASSSQQPQQVMDLFGADLGPAAFTLALLMLNMLNGNPAFLQSKPHKLPKDDHHGRFVPPQPSLKSAFAVQST